MNDLSCLTQESVALLGFPWDGYSSYLRGPAMAPSRIRQVLYSGSSNLTAENGIDLGSEPRFCDLGDLIFTPGTTALEQIETEIKKVLKMKARLLSLGGDHSVTYPLVKAHHPFYERLNILHLDAHPDLYESFDGNRYSHACPFARIMEEGLAARLVQVGIRTANAHQREQARRFGVEMIEMDDWRGEFPLEFEGPIYLSLDLDVLDPAFAPGVSHHEPGGLSTREVLRLIRGLHAPIIGADIVELNPVCDQSGITASAAAKFVKEVFAKMLAGVKS